MAHYDYYCDACGATDSRLLPMSQAKFRPECPRCGQAMERDIAAEHGEFFHRPGNWPLWSDAAGCHPKQARAFHERSVRLGVPVEFSPVDGRAKFTSARQRKRYCELEQVHLRDNNAGYSDPGKGSG